MQVRLRVSPLRDQVKLPNYQVFFIHFQFSNEKTNFTNSMVGKYEHTELAANEKL